MNLGLSSLGHQAHVTGLYSALNKPIYRWWYVSVPSLLCSDVIAALLDSSDWYLSSKSFGSYENQSQALCNDSEIMPTNLFWLISRLLERPVITETNINSKLLITRPCRLSHVIDYIHETGVHLLVIDCLLLWRLGIHTFRKLLKNCQSLLHTFLCGAII